MDKNILEINNKNGYALWAEIYDHEKNPLIAVEEPHVKRILNNISYSHVLDAGTGTGRHILNLAHPRITVTAIDNSPEMLAVAREKANNSGLEIDFNQVSLESHLPFKDEAFDLVFCSLVLTHIPNLTAVVKEFHRVCIEGGHIVITDFHPESLAQGWRTTFENNGTTYHLPNYNYTREDYLGSVGSAGFTLLQVKDIPVNEIPKGYISEETVNKYDGVGLCLIILGQK
ncbi:MAG: methyltransferase domain-containing protein [Dehalococcoidales bacterium]|nr:methyltransferase domain-containing protein [Dehalococcoidales bacterium]